MADATRGDGRVEAAGSEFNRLAGDWTSKKTEIGQRWCDKQYWRKFRFEWVGGFRFEQTNATETSGEKGEHEGHVIPPGAGKGDV